VSLWFSRVQLWLANRPLLRFLFGVVALLPACFLIWYFFGAFLAGPAAALANLVLTTWLPDLVVSAHLDGTRLVVMSTLVEVEGGMQVGGSAEEAIGYAINTRTLSYSLPFFAALYFATPHRGGLGSFAWSLLTLWLLLAVGLVATALKDLMLALGPVLIERPGMLPGDAIALLYQFSVLMVPPLAPVVLWAYVAADAPAFRELFALAGRPAQARDSRT
jgi:hypothetical protein